MSTQTETLRPRAAVSNPTIADRLNIGFTMVSRLRTGHRLPSIATMVRVEKEFRWDINEQAQAAVRGSYDREFEKVLIDVYGQDVKANASGN